MHAQARPLQPAVGQCAVARAGTPDRSRSAALLGLQRSAGNLAVSRLVAPVVQRDDGTKPLDEVLKGTDADALKPHRNAFHSLSAEQCRRVFRMVLEDNLWISRDDAITMEAAWRAMWRHRDALTDEDWSWWKKCSDRGAEIKYIPWMRELQSSFADKVRAQAQRNLEANVRSITAEAERLGIALGGAAAPAPSQQADEAVAQQRGLASQINDANNKLKALRDIPVGYKAPSWSGAKKEGDKSESRPGGVEPEPKVFSNFDPAAGPFERPDPDPNPTAGVANYETVKQVHEELTRAVARILNANPALYAMTARGGTDEALSGETATARAAMARALQDVLSKADETKADITSRALSFAEMIPVHQSISRTDPLYQSLFSKKLVNDYLTEEGGAAASGSHLVGLVTIALITGVTVATGGAAAPGVAALISLASSGAVATASWTDWAKLDTAAKSTVSDKNSIVSQEQSDAALLSALMSTAMALVDVYGAGKALRAASSTSQAAVKALEGKVSDVGKLKSIASGAATGSGREIIERSVANVGPAVTVRNVGNWRKLATTLGNESPAMGKVTAWRDEVFRETEEMVAKSAAADRKEAARAALAIAAGMEQAHRGRGRLRARTQGRRARRAAQHRRGGRDTLLQAKTRENG